MIGAMTHSGGCADDSELGTSTDLATDGVALCPARGSNAMTANQMSEGWYPDPLNAGRLRFFDGREWSDEVHARLEPGELPWTKGWFPDPLDAERSRYFDGAKWSDDIRREMGDEPKGHAQAGTPRRSAQATTPNTTASPAPSAINENGTAPQEGSNHELHAARPASLVTRARSFWDSLDSSGRWVVGGGVAGMLAICIAVLVVTASGVGGGSGNYTVKYVAFGWGLVDIRYSTSLGFEDESVFMDSGSAETNRVERTERLRPGDIASLEVSTTPGGNPADSYTCQIYVDGRLEAETTASRSSAYCQVNIE